LAAGTASAQIVFKRNTNVVRTGTQLQADTARPLPASATTGSITATVTWSKALGLPPAYPGASETTALPCGSFVIAVSNERERIKSSEGGAVGVERNTGGEQYVCQYTLEGLPKGQELRIDAVFIDTRVWETYPWISVFGTEGVAPGQGQIRDLDGGRRLVLTDAEPTANVDFRVQYVTPRRPIRIF
jgi:hypothetical protein